MKKEILLVALFFSLLGSASGEVDTPCNSMRVATRCESQPTDRDDGKSLLIKGKTELDAGKYAEAIESLIEANKRFPVLGDYTLLWLSKAYRESGRLDESNLRIKELLKNFPDSPLKKKARSIEINNLIASGDISREFQVFESYVGDYPDDYEMKFLFGELLKKKGEPEKAKTIFKNIYSNCDGAFSKMAFNELSPSDITLQDIMEKATNLMNAMEFKEAESVLREALLKNGEKRRDEILKKLGHSVFRQKRYREAAEIFGKAGDPYYKAKALFRAGEKEEFDAALKKLISLEDRRAGSLLMLAASDKRREGQTEDALRIYKNIKANYISEAEEALWGIGWTNYLKGDFQRAFDVFSDLYDVYGSSRYLYWKAKSLEGSGKNADHVFRQLAEREHDFYGVLARIKTGNGRGIRGQGVSANIQSQTPKPYSSERIDILLELGMKKEAIVELAALIKKTTRPEDIENISAKLQDIGEYRLAVNLASKLPYKESMHGILYPLAHWPVVKDVSVRYGVSPFIVLSVMREESRFDPDARSEAGALGLMQLMPYTARIINKDINLDLISDEQIHDIKTNITLGSYYLNSLIKEFSSVPQAIASYNAGEDIVKKWLKAGNYRSYDEFIEDIPYDETRNFTKRVITTYFEYLKYSGDEGTPQVF